jgi:hypothetical protein
MKFEIFFKFKRINPDLSLELTYKYGECNSLEEVALTFLDTMNFAIKHDVDEVSFVIKRQDEIKEDVKK